MTRLIDCSGPWRTRTDPQRIGRGLGWHAEIFADPVHLLPGTMDTHPSIPVRIDGSLHGPHPRRPFRGHAWHQREVVIPRDWQGMEVTLVLERCQWRTLAWIGDHFLGEQDSLVAPHLHRLPDGLPPGTHRLTLLVDNSNLKDDAETGGAGSEAGTANYDLTTVVHQEERLSCGGHHRWSHDWNGIIGRIELTAEPPVRLRDLRIDARPSLGGIRLSAAIANRHGLAGSLAISVSVLPDGDGEGDPETWSVDLNGQDGQPVERTIPLARPLATWDEFTPVLHRVRITTGGPEGECSTIIRTGARELGHDGHRLLVNGRRTFLRGTLECFTFPRDGHPPTGVESWRRRFATAKAYGLNHVRFHTCCPPEAAFDAADELGLYLQVEAPGTSCPIMDEDPAVDRFLSEEIARIALVHGNHPSLVIICGGNEQLIADDPAFIARHQAALADRQRPVREADRRHLHTLTAHPWTPGRNDDLFVSAWPPAGAEVVDRLRRCHRLGETPTDPPLCGIQWSGFRVADASRFNTGEPATVHNYDALLTGLDRPMIAHEVGQWTTYPELREIPRHDGALRAGNLELIEGNLRNRGRLVEAADWVRASGRLSLILYREEMESALRSRRMSGFQLLGLTDYPGQGTSTVGILDAFWRSKGLTTPHAFRRSCAPVVALARMERRCWQAPGPFSATIELANYGPGPLLDQAIDWRLVEADGGPIASGSFRAAAIPCDGPTEVGRIEVALPRVSTGTHLRLEVDVAGIASNRWDAWAFPPPTEDAPPPGVVLSTAWDKATRRQLESGAPVVLLLPPGRRPNAVPGTFTPVFWNALMKHRQPAKTMGLLIDPAHPCLDGFPTAFHSDWQWWDPVMHGEALDLDRLPGSLRPPVAVIDSFPGNRRLALLFECRVGAGRLLVCSADLSSGILHRPAAAQLRRSLLTYAAGPAFDPDTAVEAMVLDHLFATE